MHTHISVYSCIKLKQDYVVYNVTYDLVYVFSSNLNQVFIRSQSFTCVSLLRSLFWPGCHAYLHT